MKFLELHMLQNIPASSINRGEDGEIKTALVGGTLRQRISSQCFKRAIRKIIQEESQKNLKSSGLLSRHFYDIILNKIGVDVPEDFTSKILKDVGINKFDGDDKAVMMYLSTSDIESMVSAIKSVYIKKDEVKNVLVSFKDFVKSSHAQSAVDIALCGRMFASYPDLNVYSAVKSNHAFSTNSIECEDDYFTAVDQLDSNGSGHIGHNSFSSSCLYRYYCIDIEQFEKNMYGQSFKEHLELIIHSLISAFPTGKENTFAAYTKPRFVNFVLKSGIPVQMSDAFESPVVENGDGYLTESIKKYRTYKEEMKRFETYPESVYCDIEISPDNVSTIKDTVETIKLKLSGI